MGFYIGNKSIKGVSVSFTNKPGWSDTSDANITSGNQMLKDITAYGNEVKYTGTIETKTDNDIVVNKHVVTVPVGYYASEYNKSVTQSEIATPNISIDSAGLITSTVNQIEGYIDEGSKSSTHQLNTEAGGTYNVTDIESVICDVNVFTTGEIRAIAPTGELENPTINVDTGVVTSSVKIDGYLKTTNNTTLQLNTKSAETFTPSDSTQVISKGDFLIGDQTINPVPVEEKTVVAQVSDVVVTPTTGKYISKVTVNPVPSQNKTVTPGYSAVNVVPDSGYLLSDVTVEGDANLISENIISGKTIFGVSGNVVIYKYYTGSTRPDDSFGNDGDLYLKM